MTSDILVTKGPSSLTLYPDAPSWDGQPTAAVGRLTIASAEDGAALLRESVTTARDMGRTALLGPMDGDTWHPYRVVTEDDGSPPFPMEPKSGPHDLGALVTAGFVPLNSYVSSRAATTDLPPAVETPTGVTVTPWNGGDPSGLIGRIYEMSLASFAKAAFYKPIDRDAFLGLYAPIVPHLDPGLVLFAHSASGDVVGFLFGYPDGAGGAVLKTYASGVRGVGRALVDAFNDVVRSRGMTHVVHATMRTDNPSLARSSLNGGRVFRRYALMGLKIS